MADGISVKLLSGTRFGVVGSVITLAASVAVAEIAAGRAQDMLSLNSASGTVTATGVIFSDGSEQTTASVGGAVTSVNGQTGAAVLTAASVGADESGAAAAAIAAALAASPALAGAPTAPTPTTSDNSTAIATTAFVKAQPSGGASVVTTPGYFFPSLDCLFDAYDPTNTDPRSASLNNLTSYKLFYLPFNITITRYRFHMDGNGGASAASFYAGIYDVTGALIFDIGQIDLTPGGGNYGSPESLATFNTGTRFFDASRNPQSAITLSAGWYYYGWGGYAADGTGLVFPQMGPLSSLYGEMLGTDAVGLGSVPKRWAHSGSYDIAAGHLPLTIHSDGGTADAPPNIVFFA